MIKVGIVEDNAFLALAIVEKLEAFDDFEIVVKANYGQEILQKIKTGLDVDLLLMDIQMPILDGIEATRQIKAIDEKVKIVMLTVMDDDESILNAIKAGADGYLLKDTSAIALRTGLIETMNGGASMTPSIASKTLKYLQKVDPRDLKPKEEDFELTSREIDVLQQVAKGLPNKLIADKLSISPSTVGKHIENIYTKLQVHSRVEAVMKAQGNAII